MFTREKAVRLVEDRGFEVHGVFHEAEAFRSDFEDSKDIMIMPFEDGYVVGKQEITEEEEYPNTWQKTEAGSFDDRSRLFCTELLAEEYVEFPENDVVKIVFEIGKPITVFHEKEDKK